MRLKSLYIKNFRAFNEFEVNKIGQLNLIVGKNNSGKSSVLEALRIYAGGANRALLNEVASEHEEVYRILDATENEELNELPYEHFFCGRAYPMDDTGAIVIGEKLGSSDALKINHELFIEYEENFTDEDGDTYVRKRRKMIPKRDVKDFVDRDIKQAVTVTLNNRMRLYELSSNMLNRSSSSQLADEIIPCAYIPTQFISVDELADIWDKVLFTEYEKIVIKALQIISPECENIAFVKSDIRNSYNSATGRKEMRRSAKVKMKGMPKALPLNSMGDGMLRILQLILKTIPAKGGFLLIDEFENGLHFSVQQQIWSLLFDLSKKLKIQIFATTHSWDCVESFAKVAQEKENIEGVLFRVGRSVLKSDNGKIIATIFDENKLANITQSDVEVR